MFMYWLEKLRQFKADSRETYKSISQKTGIPKTTVEKLFSGRTADPGLIMVSKLALCLGHSAAELLPSDGGAGTDKERELIKKYRLLDKAGRGRVENVISGELERVRAQKPRYYSMYYDFPVSAGTGDSMDYTNARIIELAEEPEAGTDFVLRIAGDSMEPEFTNGDLVCVKSAEQLEFGDIGIFAYDGNVYMKEYTDKGLRSLNPKYALIKGSRGIRILGKVLGKTKRESNQN